MRKVCYQVGTTVDGQRCDGLWGISGNRGASYSDCWPRGEGTETMFP